jgi:hypothetical protein
VPVIADIRRDHGIAPGDLRDVFWNKLNLAVFPIAALSPALSMTGCPGSSPAPSVTALTLSTPDRRDPTDRCQETDP